MWIMRALKWSHWQWEVGTATLTYIYVYHHVVHSIGAFMYLNGKLTSGADVLMHVTFKYFIVCLCHRLL